MPINMTIRDVPNEVRDQLAMRAAASGRSIQEFVRMQLIELARRPSPEDLTARIRDRKVRTGSRLDAADILAHRTADQP